VVGPLTGSGIVLKTRPVTITSWAAWRAANPETKVLSLDTGYRRDYRPGQPYGDYFASPALMFPTRVDETQLQAKDYVFALRSSGAEKAWPLSRFAGGAVINDTAGVLDIVLIGAAATRSVRAYRRDGRTFEPTDDPAQLRDRATGETWRVTEEALTGPAGRVVKAQQSAATPATVAGLAAQNVFPLQQPRWGGPWAGLFDPNPQTALLQIHGLIPQHLMRIAAQRAG